MAHIVLVHGSGGPKPEEDWLGPLNTALAMAGYSPMEPPEDSVTVVNYRPKLQATTLDRVERVRTTRDDQQITLDRANYVIRQKAMESALLPHMDRVGSSPFAVAPDWMQGPVASAVEFLIFGEVHTFMTIEAGRNAVWRTIVAAIPKRKPCIVVAHSLGALAMMGVLDRLGANMNIELLVTVGGPMAIGRYAGHAPERFPDDRVQRWLNVYSPTDGVTGGLASRFHEVA